MSDEDRVRIAILTGALKEYGRHSEGCNAPHGYPCKCGFDHILHTLLGEPEPARCSLCPEEAVTSDVPASPMSREERRRLRERISPTPRTEEDDGE